MTYRDEKDSLRSQVTHLESELEEANRTIARLKGETTAAAAGDGAKLTQSRILDAPIKFERVHELPYEVSEEGYEAIAKLLRERLALQVSQVGRTLTGYATPAGRAPMGPPVFSLSREEGVTRIKLNGDWSMLAGGVVASGFMGALFGGLPAIGILADLSHRMPMLSPLHALWIVPSIAGSAAYLVRRLVKKRAVAQAETYRGVFETMLQLAEEHAVRDEKPAVRARVAVEGEQVEVEAERPAERINRS